MQKKPLCKQCGDPLINGNQYYCDKECQRIHTVEKNTKECKGCGELFTAAREYQIYHNKKCWLNHRGIYADKIYCSKYYDHVCIDLRK